MLRQFHVDSKAFFNDKEGSYVEAFASQHCIIKYTLLICLFDDQVNQWRKDLLGRVVGRVVG